MSNMLQGVKVTFPDNDEIKEESDTQANEQTEQTGNEQKNFSLDNLGDLTLTNTNVKWGK